MPLQFFFFIFFLLHTQTLSAPVANPGCQKKCGKLQIPYPFGIGSNCSMHPDFDVVCKNTTKPYINLSFRQLEIVNINTTQIRVTYPYLLAAACYNNTSHDFPMKNYITRDEYYQMNLQMSKYSLSDENWLTAFGCDDIVAGFGENSQSFAGGCVSYCSLNESATAKGHCPNTENGYSAGNGCCRTPIPKGTTYLAAQLSDLSGKWLRDKLFPCSYAFVEEKKMTNATYSFPFAELNKSMVSRFDNWPLTSRPPVVRLDWRVGSKICSEAQRNLTTYACQANSVCVNVEVFDQLYDHGGYLCRCMKGFFGNPYLVNGCKHINECDDDALNPCAIDATCINTPGHVHCSCAKGYDGDGRKNGKGCIPSTSTNVFMGVGYTIGILLLVAFCIFLYLCKRKRSNKRRKERFFIRNGGLILEQQTRNQVTNQKTQLFSEKELEKAIDNFNESRVIGRGGQGTVYKGMLSDGKIVAIKKAKVVNEVRLDQFINEIVVVSQIIHKNVVKLWGCCLETEVPLLVYEMLPNGTLEDFIHDSEYLISWNMRLKFASDVAAALAYLHSTLSVPIFHRDIKTANILLDEKYRVKLADFGLARLVGMEQTHVNTDVKGTFGYFDPEYYLMNVYTDKSDVYSFGVVLVELLTGQKPTSLDMTTEQMSLVARFVESLEQNKLHTMLDPQISDEDEVTAVALLAKRCLNAKGRFRPTMKEVVTQLESLKLCDEAQHMQVSDAAWTATGFNETTTSFSFNTI